MPIGQVDGCFGTLPEDFRCGLPNLGLLKRQDIKPDPILLLHQTDASMVKISEKN